MKSDFLDYGPNTNDRLASLLREGAEAALALLAEDDLVLRVEEAGLISSGEFAGYDDPVLIASIRRAIRTSIINWLNCTIEKPSSRVPAFVSETAISNAITMTEMGMPELMYSIGKSAQNVAWQHWMNVAFKICEDPKELKLLLEVSFNSIASYIQDSEALLQLELKNHSKLYSSRYSAEKRDLVIKLLDGDSSSARKLLPRLGYVMEVKHYSAIIWCEDGSIELSALEHAADVFIGACGKNTGLVINASRDVIWVWCEGGGAIDHYVLSQIVGKLEGVKMVYAPGDKGLEGFRAAHIDALAAQRVLGRLRSSAKIVSYDNLRLAEIMSNDAEAANSYISNTLGKLNDASPEIWRSLLVYIQCACNANQASKILYTHRNTLIRRLGKAEELLPKPLSENLVHVAAALEIKRWLL